MLKKLDFQEGKSPDEQPMVDTVSQINSCSTPMYFYHFTASKALNGWIEKFEKLHSITFRAISGESTLIDSIMVEEWKAMAAHFTSVILQERRLQCR